MAYPGLAAGGFAEVPAHLADRPVTGLASDSRAVRLGDLFSRCAAGAGMVWNSSTRCARRERWRWFGNHPMRACCRLAKQRRLCWRYRNCVSAWVDRQSFS